MKIQSPWMGRVRGSAGNMTGCKVYDKNVMRAKAFEVSNPNTAAQQVQRGYFADLIELVAGFSPEQLRTLFPNKPKAMSRRNALAKQLADYNTMEGTEKVIDYANIDTLGNAPTANLPEVLVSNSELHMQLAWDSTSFADQSLKSNKIVIVTINETKHQIAMISEDQKFDDDEAILSYPNGWEEADTINAFLLISDTETLDASFGSFIIKVRPAKKSN